MSFDDYSTVEKFLDEAVQQELRRHETLENTGQRAVDAYDWLLENGGGTYEMYLETVVPRGMPLSALRFRDAVRGHNGDNVAEKHPESFVKEHKKFLHTLKFRSQWIIQHFYSNYRNEEHKTFCDDIKATKAGYANYCTCGLENLTGCRSGCYNSSRSNFKIHFSSSTGRGFVDHPTYYRTEYGTNVFLSQPYGPVEGTIQSFEDFLEKRPEFEGRYTAHFSSKPLWYSSNTHWALIHKVNPELSWRIQERLNPEVTLNDRLS